MIASIASGRRGAGDAMQSGGCRHRSRCARIRVFFFSMGTHPRRQPGERNASAVAGVDDDSAGEQTGPCDLQQSAARRIATGRLYAVLRRRDRPTGMKQLWSSSSYWSA